MKGDRRDRLAKIWPRASFFPAGETSGLLRNSLNSAFVSNAFFSWVSSSSTRSIIPSARATWKRDSAYALTNGSLAIEFTYFRDVLLNQAAVIFGIQRFIDDLCGRHDGEFSNLLPEFKKGLLFLKFNLLLARFTIWFDSSWAFWMISFRIDSLAPSVIHEFL